MLQLAELTLAILGLSGAVSIQAVCWTVIGCELVRIVVDYRQKQLED